MKSYQPYIDSLEALIAEATSPSMSKKKLVEYLGGDSSCTELRRLVTLSDMRESGIFFTHKKLCEFALGSISTSVTEDSIFFDPACGSGNLLAECTQYLPKKSTLDQTIQMWGERIIGRDLYQEFISAAKGRLLLEAVRRGAKVKKNLSEIPQRVFPLLKVGSAFDAADSFKRATHIVMNPPYTLVTADKTCRWSSGLVSYAAVFLEHCLKSAADGAKVIAILPDVLRSGSRYEKWRALVSQYAKVDAVKTYGIFDRKTDVHVFVLELTLGKQLSTEVSGQWMPKKATEVKVGEHFDVSIGPVVDYRDPDAGSWYPYLIAKNLPRWEIVKQVETNRRFKGRVLRPPFVVVRRTSRPEDADRAVATVVNISKPVSVDNHLIVLSPKDGTLESCIKLSQSLKNRKTSQWLNARIRCRHLTVSSLRDLPWWDK